MAGEAFQLARDVEGALDHRIAVALGLQLGFALNGLRQRDRAGGILRHQLAQLVDLAVGHLQHAADVAQHAARLQRAEGDDLRHLVAAVALLHIFDDFAAAVLAEVDVEVRHRHAFWIQKALEQQAEADRIEIGDGERIRDQGAGAGAAAGADRNAFHLGVLDEVGDDQEVAGIFHVGDDAELEVEPLAIFVDRVAGRHAGGGEPQREAGLGALAQLLGLVDHAAALAQGETRQDRLMRVRAERTALGNFHRTGERLRQIGEQFAHLGAGLEAMFGGELAAVALRDEAAFGDANQRVVRLVVGDGGEVRLVGGDQRKLVVVGEIDQHRLGHAFGAGAVALQLDIKPVAEQAHQRIEARGGEMALAGGDGLVERTAGAAGERDDAAGLALEPFELEPWRLVRRRIEEGARGQPHQAAIAGLGGGEQHDARAFGSRIGGGARPVIAVAEIDRQRAADDRLDAGGGELLGEFERAEHVVGVGERERRLLVGFRQLGQARDGERAFQQRIGRVHVQMHEIEIGQVAIPWLAPRVGTRRAQVHRQGRGTARYAGFQQGADRRNPSTADPVRPGIGRNARLQPGRDNAGTPLTMRHNSQITERFYRLLKTCDQMAIMPTNSASDASAAASWMTALTMASSPERRENIVHGMFYVKRREAGDFQWANGSRAGLFWSLSRRCIKITQAS